MFLYYYIQLHTENKCHPNFQGGVGGEGGGAIASPAGLPLANPDNGLTERGPSGRRGGVCLVALDVVLATRDDNIKGRTITGIGAFWT